jgi:integrase
MATFIPRHKKGCRILSGEGKRCSCSPSYQARVKLNGRSGRPHIKSFPTLSAAKAWARDVEAAYRRGLIASTPGTETVREAGERLIEAMRSGVVLDRTGEPYRPRTIDSYETSLVRHVYPDLGQVRLHDLRRRDVQRLVDRLVEEGVASATVHNAVTALKVVVRRAIQLEHIAVSPCDHLALPARRSAHRRGAIPVANVEQMLDVLRPDDRALWATAVYAGLRRGELAGLDWSDVDLGRNVLRVSRSFDSAHRLFGPPKSNAGYRTVPIVAPLRRRLIEHKLVTGRTEGLVFGVTASTPFTPSAVRRRAVTAWRRAGLPMHTLHEGRHTFASLAAASGLTVKEMTEYVGHAHVSTTLDRYGHLFEGHEAASGGKMDTYLDSIRTRTA